MLGVYFREFCRAKKEELINEGIRRTSKPWLLSSFFFAIKEEKSEDL